MPDLLPRRGRNGDSDDTLYKEQAYERARFGHRVLVVEAVERSFNVFCPINRIGVSMRLSKTRRMALFVLFCVAFACVACARDLWILHQPKAVPRELAYLAGLLIIGICVLAEPKLKHWRVLLPFALGAANMSCAIWLWAGNARFIALAMAIAGCLFLLEAFRLYRSGSSSTNVTASDDL